MNNIHDLSLSKLNSLNLRTFCGKLIELIAQITAADQFLARQVMVLDKALKVVVDIDNTPLGSNETPEIKATDAVFDKLLVNCRDALNLNVEMNEPGTPKHDSSKALLALLSKRTSALYYGGYAAQGSEFESLAAELFLPVNDKSRKDSELDPFFEKLKTTYAKLKQLLTARLSEGNLPTTLKDQKEVLRFRVNAILTHIDTEIEDKVPGVLAVQTPINELITEIMGHHRSAETRKANAVEAE